VKFSRAQSQSRNRIEAAVTSVWFDKKSNPAARFLFWLVGTPISWLTLRKASTARHRIIKAKRNPPTPPVLIVGNLTPLTIAITNALAQRNYRIGLICRGDGAHKRVQAPIVVDQHSEPGTVGDEALLLSQSTGLPVCVCAHRDLARLQLLKDYPDLDLVISDDGLQHEALNRTIELVVFDQRGIGNGRLLPAGPLREPLTHLTEMNAVILNKGFSPSSFISTEPHIEHTRLFASYMSIRDVVSLAQFNDISAPNGQTVEQFVKSCGRQRVAALAGIANPATFFASLESAGLQIRPVASSDHANLGASELSAITEPIIIMTAKDAVKCPPDPRVFVLRVQANPPADLINWMTEQFNGLPAA